MLDCIQIEYAYRMGLPPSFTLQKITVSSKDPDAIMLPLGDQEQQDT